VSSCHSHFFNNDEWATYKILGYIETGKMNGISKVYNENEYSYFTHPLSNP